MIFSRIVSFLFFLVSAGLFAGAKPVVVDAELVVRDEFASGNALEARGGGCGMYNESSSKGILIKLISP